MEAGKVKVNGKVITKMGTKVSPKDKIEVEGKTLKTIKEHTTILLHKPSGYITSRSDPYHSKTVMDLLPKELQHLKPAGRLDKESEGLLILSSDGKLIQELTHPSASHIKTYEILVKGKPTEKDLFPLTSGKLKLDDYTLNPMEFRILKSTRDRKTWVELKLTEGRKRQIRRVMDQLGFPVVYLKRTQIDSHKLGKIEKGEYRTLL
jgi:pseudouridine synthase